MLNDPVTDVSIIWKLFLLYEWNHRKPDEKLEWAFQMYDIDGNGTIDQNEMIEIIKVCSWTYNWALLNHTEQSTKPLELLCREINLLLLMKKKVKDFTQIGSNCFRCKSLTDFKHRFWQNHRNFQESQSCTKRKILASFGQD